LDLTILGSGTSVPSLKRGSSGYLVREKETLVLLDCGPGTLLRLLRAGASLEEITHVVFSHHHVDHCADLAPLLFTSRNPDRPRRAPLTIAASPEFLEYLADLTRLHGTWLQPSGYRLELTELAETAVRLGALEAAACRVPHIASSVAVRLTGDGGRSLVYSGDTDEGDALADLARKADLLLIESSSPDESKLAGHLTPSLAGRIAARAQPAKVVLTHFYPACEGADMMGQLRRTYGGDAVLAADGMRLEVR